MNKETNDFLLENLDEAHQSFTSLIKEMKENNIDEDYYELEKEERDSYNVASNAIKQMTYYVNEANTIREENDELYQNERLLFIKYSTLYGVSLAFIKLFHIIFNTDNMSDMTKYSIGMILGSVYVALLCKDISDNRSDTKEKRDALNKIKTMKEEYKKTHDDAVLKIDSIFSTNTKLWKKFDSIKVKSK